MPPASTVTFTHIVSARLIDDTTGEPDGSTYYVLTTSENEAVCVQTDWGDEYDTSRCQLDVPVSVPIPKGL